MIPRIGPTPGRRLGPYEVLAKLGEGGMGEVYKARDTRLDRTVAIKVLPAAVADDPYRLRRFEHEARAIASVNHPHICETEAWCEWHWPLEVLGLYGPAEAGHYIYGNSKGTASTRRVRRS
jgi:serine/threonine protein kinase